MAKVTRDALIAHGVRNLRQFGYPSVTTENILTDVEINALLAQIKEPANATP